MHTSLVRRLIPRYLRSRAPREFSPSWYQTRARRLNESHAAHGSRGKPVFAIAESLTRDGIPSPSAHDPARNTHRDGIAWAKSAVRAIVTNPRYTGYQVWYRQRTDEVLLDVENVALGHTVRRR